MQYSSVVVGHMTQSFHDNSAWRQEEQQHRASISDIGHNTDYVSKKQHCLKRKEVGCKAAWGGSNNSVQAEMGKSRK